MKPCRSAGKQESETLLFFFPGGSVISGKQSCLCFTIYGCFSREGSGIKPNRNYFGVDTSFLNPSNHAVCEYWQQWVNLVFFTSSPLVPLLVGINVKNNGERTCISWGKLRRACSQTYACWQRYKEGKQMICVSSQEHHYTNLFHINIIVIYFSLSTTYYV